MKKRFSGPQIVAKLRQADVLIGQSKTVPEVCKEIEISQQTYYRWRQKYGGMSPDMIKQLKAVRRSVLSKAPLRSAFLKTRRMCVKYSHNNWYIKRGQASSRYLDSLAALS